MSDGDDIELPRPLKGPPRGYFVVLPPRVREDSISLGKLISLMRDSWVLLFLSAIGGACLAAIISLAVRSTYRAMTLAAPVTQSSGGIGGALRSQFGGIAALAGVDLGSGGGRKDESIATLSSLGFARDFIVAENLLPVLFADKWDAGANDWRDPSQAPTLEAGVKRYTQEVRTVSEDRRTGLVTVTVEWYSRELAARWANGMIEMVNDRLRSEAAQSAEKSIEYLNKELAGTSEVSLRQSISQLIEVQVNTAMMANVQRQFAFRIIDRAVPPEIRAFPKRALFVVVGILGGMLLAFFAVLTRHTLRIGRDTSDGANA
jgi:uncharacterized protein involved in exopolysaccharide biosynthesis